MPSAYDILRDVQAWMGRYNTSIPFPQSTADAIETFFKTKRRSHQSKNGIRLPFTITSSWQGWTYDVWGNARDGWEVNDRSCFDRNILISARPRLYNCPAIPLPGSTSASCDLSFVSFIPSDRELLWAIGAKGLVVGDEGDDTHIYLDLRNGKPYGELLLNHFIDPITNEPMLTPPSHPHRE